MIFSDIHQHALYGCDDGASTKEEMLRIVDAAYADGTRYLCLTPHFHPKYYGDNRGRSDAAFAELCEYCGEKYPDLVLAIGNELHYDLNFSSWISEGRCRTLGGTDFVLIDFSFGEKKKVIESALNSLMNAGYAPVLAHAERYVHLRGEWRLIDSLRSRGVLIQLDAQSLFGESGLAVKRFSHGLLRRRMIDFVSSDAHGVDSRPPELSRAYEVIARRHSQEYADIICLENAKRLVFTR